ncbi:MAG: RHS repeat-associated core domain-containing protein, partial [Bacteroidota bacterium]
QSNNHNYGTELSYAAFDFAGKVLKTKTIHEYNSAKEVKIRNRYQYDHAGRVKRVFQQNNNDPEIVLSESHYNGLGQLVEKNIHQTTGANTWLQSVDYGYHIRGWLKNINDCDLKNNLLSMGKTHYLEKVKLKVKERKDQYNNKSLYLQITLDKCDDPNYGPGTSSEQQVTEIKLMDSTPGNPAFDELYAIKGQNIPVNFQFESLAPAAVAQTEATAAVAFSDALDQKGVTHPDAISKAVVTACSFVLAQAPTDYVNNDNDDLWGMELAFEAGNASLNADPRWNGNITAMCWKSKSDNVKRGYGYRYDVLSRLTQAKYKAQQNGGSKWNFEVGHYDVPKISYDENGNITRLNRMGYVEVNGNPSFGAMDKLRYKYRGNQLRSVKDNATVTGYDDFRDNGAISNFDYAHDGNGNLVSDANKGYTASWNYLNLPEKVDFGGGREILWLYDAGGTKLKKVIREAGQPYRVREYLGGAVYQDGSLEFFHSEEGRVVRDAGNGTQFRYEYFFQDHLGNTRLGFSDLNHDGVIDPQSEILQEAHYYPYGGTFAGIAAPQIGPEFGFKFNDKEIQSEFGFQLHDFGARLYDSQLGRWIGVDPLVEKFVSFSPYHAFDNSPINIVDEMGLGGEDALKGSNWAGARYSVTAYALDGRIYHVYQETFVFRQEVSLYRFRDQFATNRGQLKRYTNTTITTSTVIDHNGETMQSFRTAKYDVRYGFYFKDFKHDGDESYSIQSVHEIDLQQDPIFVGYMEGLEAVSKELRQAGDPGYTMLGNKFAQADATLNESGLGAGISGAVISGVKVIPNPIGYLMAGAGVTLSLLGELAQHFRPSTIGTSMEISPQKSSTRKSLLL